MLDFLRKIVLATFWCTNLLFIVNLLLTCLLCKILPLSSYIWSTKSCECCLSNSVFSLAGSSPMIWLYVVSFGDFGDRIVATFAFRFCCFPSTVEGQDSCHSSLRIGLLSFQQGFFFFPTCREELWGLWTATRSRCLSFLVADKVCQSLLSYPPWFFLQLWSPLQPIAADFACPLLIRPYPSGDCPFSLSVILFLNFRFEVGNLTPWILRPEPLQFAKLLQSLIVS